jgi:LysM repeat protein
MTVFDRVLSRRRLLAGSAGAAGAWALALRPALGAVPRQAPIASTTRAVRTLALPSNHLAWVWDFTRDGPLAPMLDTLSAYGLGIALKTHDGVDWMSKYDPSKDAVSGARRVAQLADTFDSHGIPFYCWCVVRGEQPATEATMAADVLDAGARGLFVDLESYPGFWSGTSSAATLYGSLLRERQPDASVLLTVDARPWEIASIPLREFSSFASAIAPQVYWPDFATAPNLAKYRKEGEDPPASGITPAFALDAAAKKLDSLDFPLMPLVPIGPGTAEDTDAWKQFIDVSFEHLARSISVWRLGTASEPVLTLLKDHPAPDTYTVRSGDLVGALATSWGTSVAEVVRWNGLADPNLVRIGQELIVPPASATQPPPQLYTVQPGDTLIGLAAQWHTTPDAIAQLNGLADQQYIRIGQQLTIP